MKYEYSKKDKEIDKKKGYKENSEEDREDDKKMEKGKVKKGKAHMKALEKMKK